ncbi:JDVT-CTERM system glutamic-type intramembrane protease [Vibrio sp. 10N.261.46.E12]|uniref:JDVT-CTERM system glutamic-type intramembrane protease MrtJ n=1 Tax=unclassified Vibrio TaxID=2614977 RepID=UPI000C866FBF|nr:MULTISPECIES: JDVT-CTERM system glutamic-type intramembrane protease [unclassified Vibrio]PMN91792.1 hypothetical protein BCT25_03510 [Vibrio sp. 10N.261.45.A6]
MGTHHQKHGSRRIHNCRQAHKDKQLHITVCLSIAIGLAFWFALPYGLNNVWPITTVALVNILLVYPVLEEVSFRGGIHDFLLKQKLLNNQYYGVSVSNVVTSCLFASFHLMQHPPLFAALTFIPSVILGHFKERYGSLLVPIALHCLFNAIFLMSLAIKSS